VNYYFQRSMTETKKDNVTWVVTGASRGIGFETVRQLNLDETNIIFACARDPDTAKELNALKAKNERIHVVKLDVADEKSIKAAAAEVAKKVKKVDVLINNAGALTPGKKLKNTTADDILTIYRTNVIGPHLMTQAFLGLLQAGIREDADKKKDTNIPKVINISSSMVSLETMTNYPASFFNLPYCSSKTALNMVTLTASKDEPDIAFIPLDPGWVQTDMGKTAGSPPLTAEESVKGILSTIGKITLSETGKFYAYTGKVVPW